MKKAYIFDEYFRNQLKKLREEKGISARSMSLEIGQCEDYINSIERGKSAPSMSVFYFICEYFNITPSEFYDCANTTPKRMRRTVDNLKKLDERQFNVVASLISELKKKQEHL